MHHFIKQLKKKNKILYIHYLSFDLHSVICDLQRMISFELVLHNPVHQSSLKIKSMFVTNSNVLLVIEIISREMNPLLLLLLFNCYSLHPSVTVSLHKNQNNVNNESGIQKPTHLITYLFKYLLWLFTSSLSSLSFSSFASSSSDFSLSVACIMIFKKGLMNGSWNSHVHVR